MVNVCVPVLKRYDLLQDLVNSLKKSRVVPTCLYIIDNGRNKDRLVQVIDAEAFRVEVHTPPKPMGVAESWNWFIKNVPEERIIANDDVVFGGESLELLVSAKADLVWAQGCGFSCFLIRNSCVEKIGLFDEAISPGYGYYEDEDYLQRLDGRGTRPPSAIAANVRCGVEHFKSSTLQASTHEEQLAHHRKFKIAQANYMNKWGLSSL